MSHRIPTSQDNNESPNEADKLPNVEVFAIWCLSFIHSCKTNAKKYGANLERLSTHTRRNSCIESEILPSARRATTTCSSLQPVHDTSIGLQS